MKRGCRSNERSGWMEMREKKLIELYAFAVRYARAYRNQFVEVDDLAHEMMLAVLKTRWRGGAYATRIMRNRFLDLARRGKLERVHSVPFESPEVQNKFVSDLAQIEAGIEVSHLMEQLPRKQASVLIRFMQGGSTGVSRMTVHRYIKQARELVNSK